MTVKKSRLLVIDTSVVCSAGETKHGESTACREARLAILERINSNRCWMAGVCLSVAFPRKFRRGGTRGLSFVENSSGKADGSFLLLLIQKSLSN